MLYQEPIPGRSWWLWITAAFLLLYVPFLGVPELQTPEAVAVAVAEGMRAGGGWLEPRLHGEVMPVMPLYSWAVAVCQAAGFSAEWAARLPSVLAVLGIAGVSGLMAARMSGHLAGVVAAAFCVSTWGVLREGRTGQETVVAALLLTTAWFAWYRFGRGYKRWGLAWAMGLGLATLAFFAVGVKAFLFFYLPLLFLRRPLRIWPRFWLWPHLVMLAFAGVMVWVWYSLFPEQLGSLWPENGNSLIQRLSVGFFRHLWEFPLQCGILLLPWVLLAWPGYCAAFRLVEKTPTFCRYLRTLTVSWWLVAWALPWFGPEDLLPLVGPLAVMTGLHAEILLRRHARTLLRVIPFLAWGAMAVAGATGLFLILHFSGTVDFARLTARTGAACTAAALGAFVLAGWLRRAAAKLSWPYWRMLLFGVVALNLAVLSFHPVYRSLFFERRRASGETLAAAVPEKAMVYQLHEAYLAAEVHYLDRPVHRIRTPAELPATAPELYVLAGAKPPILETRRWEPVSPPVNWRQRFHAVWRWFPEAGRLFRVDRCGDENAAAPAAGDTARMYRGTLKPAVDQIPGVLTETSLPAAAPAGAVPETRSP